MAQKEGSLGSKKSCAASIEAGVQYSSSILVSLHGEGASM